MNQGNESSLNGRQSYLNRAVDSSLMTAALRTAFVARFIVLREGRRTKAHRIIENMEWSSETTADELAATFREAFEQNGDKLAVVDRDIGRALTHAKRSATFFLEQYLQRATTNFQDALKDYVKSNQLLFEEEQAEDAGKKSGPRIGGWRLPA